MAAMSPSCHQRRRHPGRRQIRAGPRHDRGRVKSVTPQPIKYVFSTHYHEDHSGGNGKFLPTAEIISTPNARTNILEHKQSNGESGYSAGAGCFHG